MPSQPINLDGVNPIGRVTAVDTARAFINVDDHDELMNVIVGNLLAIQGSIGHQFLIAIVERITRLPGEEFEVLGTEAIEETLEPEDLKDNIRGVLVGTYWTDRGGSGPVFQRGAKSCPQIDSACYILKGANLSAFMGTLSGGIAQEVELELGHYVIDPSARAVADGNRFFQRHAAILGSTGAGKSWTVALLLEKAKSLCYPNLIVLDMHGEYSSLCKGEHGYATQMRIAGPGDLTYPSGNTIFLPYWLLNREEMLSMLLDRSDQNAPNQAAVFTDLVRRHKDAFLEGANKKDVRATFTVDSPIPYDLDAVLAELEQKDTEMVPGAGSRSVKGQLNGKLTRFISRFKAKIVDRRYGFMFSPPKDAQSYNWLPELAKRLLGSDSERPGIKILDLSEVPSDVLPIVAGVFARLVFDIQFWMKPKHRTPVCLVCDEAHQYLPVRGEADSPSRRALESFERIAKEGRKYGLSILVASQRPSDVSRTILSQCNNFIVLRLTNVQDQSAIKSVMPDSMAAITDVLPLLDVGEALILGDAVLLPSRVQLHKPRVKPLSLTKDFWSEWNELSPDPAAIENGVEAMRRQNRG
ncbi:MAG: DUF87 domain-containing protein [Armatimonadetes bacterium]|nr:DUF87 domain-containing protein [Armatimonadota bacterium]